MNDILNQLGTVITDWSTLGKLAGLIALVNLLTNLTKIQWVKDKVRALFRISADTLKKVLPWMAVFLGAAGGFLTALQQGKPIPQALVTGMVVGLSAIGAHELLKKGKSGEAETTNFSKPTNVSLLVLVVALLVVPACSIPGPVQPPANALIDCLGSNRGAVDDLLNEARPLLSGKQITWAQVWDKGKTAGKDIGTCFVMELANWWLGGTRAPEDAHEAYETAQRFRTEIGGGATLQAICLKEDGSKQVCKL